MSFIGKYRNIFSRLPDTCKTLIKISAVENFVYGCFSTAFYLYIIKDITVTEMSLSEISFCLSGTLLGAWIAVNKDRVCRRFKTLLIIDFLSFLCVTSLFALTGDKHTYYFVGWVLQPCIIQRMINAVIYRISLRAAPDDAAKEDYNLVKSNICQISGALSCAVTIALDQFGVFDEYVWAPGMMAGCTASSVFYLLYIDEEMYS